MDAGKTSAAFEALASSLPSCSSSSRPLVSHAVLHLPPVDPTLPPRAITVVLPRPLLPQHSQVSPRGRQTLYPFKKNLWLLCQEPSMNLDSSREVPVGSGGRAGQWSREWPSAADGIAFPPCSSSFWWSDLGHITQYFCVSVALSANWVW